MAKRSEKKTKPKHSNDVNRSNAKDSKGGSRSASTVGIQKKEINRDRSKLLHDPVLINDSVWIYILLIWVASSYFMTCSLSCFSCGWTFDRRLMFSLKYALQRSFYELSKYCRCADLKCMIPERKEIRKAV